MTQAAILAASGSPGTTTGFKNKIINGAMVIDQRNAGASVTPVSGAYTLDRWIYNASQASKVTIQQNAGSVTPPSGFKSYLGVTVSASANVTIGAGDYFDIEQRIEGFNTSDLDWGNANAKTITLSFWVRSSLTGTFGGALRNSNATRTCPFSYTISSANTWEQKAITIAGDISGTWNTANGAGVIVGIALGYGTTYGNGTAGVWTSSDFESVTGAVSVVSTNSATFYITGVQFEVGTTATNFDFRSYGTELQLCQRYCYTQRGVDGSRLGFGWTGSTTQASMVINLPVTMRAAPTLTSCTAISVNDNQQAYIVSNTVLGDGSTSTAVYLTVTSSGMTIGRGAQVYFTTSSGLMILNAEL